MSESFGQMIARRRARLGWSLGDTADKLGVSRDTVRGWESGRQFPHLTTRRGVDTILREAEQQAVAQILEEHARGVPDAVEVA